MPWNEFMMCDIDEKFGFREGFDTKLAGDGLDDFRGLRGQRGRVYDDSCAEFLVVEGVDKVFHEGDADGGFC